MNIQSVRHRGFVLGFDPSPEGQKIWKVRVKDTESEYDGEKFIVISVQGGLELARGLNVHFVIGNIDDQFGNKVSRAVDVCLEMPNDSNQRHSRSGGQS